MSEFDANGVDALPGVPRVDVIDETGRAVDTGYYFRHIKRTPCVFGDCVRPEDVEHLSNHARWRRRRAHTVLGSQHRQG